MKILIGAIAVLVMLVASLDVTLTAITPSVFALTAYQSGFEHGVSDGKDNCLHPDRCHHQYILQPGKGFEFHSWDFIRGYVIGWCSSSRAGGMDSDQASFDYAKGPDSASWLITRGLGK